MLVPGAEQVPVSLRGAAATGSCEFLFTDTRDTMTSTMAGISQCLFAGHGYQIYAVLLDAGVSFYKEDYCSRPYIPIDHQTLIS